MINEKSYTKEWIDTLRKRKQKINPTLCEKMIRALGLLEQLVINQLDFVFKGGTSLILLIGDPQRFSIDIDINTVVQKKELEMLIEKIIKSGVFKRFEENKRKNSCVPKGHYKFYYDSIVNLKEDYVLLDVLFHKHSYTDTTQTPIKSFWIATDHEDVLVTTPTIDAILGDKLTAYAPNTIGIPYGRSKGMEIIKQLFDVGRLFDLTQNITVVSNSFFNIAREEIKFRENKYSIEDVLHDIIETGLTIANLPKDDTQEQKELIVGIKRFKGYPIAYRYNVDDAKLSASKASYLASSILSQDQPMLKKYTKSIQLPLNFFKDEFSYLNKLRKQLPEAYFYWMSAFEVRE